MPTLVYSCVISTNKKGFLTVKYHIVSYILSGLYRSSAPSHLNNWIIWMSHCIYEQTNPDCGACVVHITLWTLLIMYTVMCSFISTTLEKLIVCGIKTIIDIFYTSPGQTRCPSNASNKLLFKCISNVHFTYTGFIQLCKTRLNVHVDVIPWKKQPHYNDVLWRVPQNNNKLSSPLWRSHLTGKAFDIHDVIVQLIIIWLPSLTLFSCLIILDLHLLISIGWKPATDNVSALP